MAKLLSHRFFMLVAPEMSLSELRPINQQEWADKLDVTQPTMGKLLDAFVEGAVFIEGPPDVKARQFRVNPAAEGVQQHYNRRM